jgi:hypothetical protein
LSIKHIYKPALTGITTVLPKKNINMKVIFYAINDAGIKHKKINRFYFCFKKPTLQLFTPGFFNEEKHEAKEPLISECGDIFRKLMYFHISPKIDSRLYNQLKVLYSNEIDYPVHHGKFSNEASFGLVLQEKTREQVIALLEPPFVFQQIRILLKYMNYRYNSKGENRFRRLPSLVIKNCPTGKCLHFYNDSEYALYLINSEIEEFLKSKNNKDSRLRTNSSRSNFYKIAKNVDDFDFTEKSKKFVGNSIFFAD